MQLIVPVMLLEVLASTLLLTTNDSFIRSFVLQTAVSSGRLSHVTSNA